MATLATPLATLLEQVDRAWAEERFSAARQQAEQLVEQAQARGEPAFEVSGRAVLVQCALQRGDAELARAELEQAERMGDRLPSAAKGRLWMARARLRAAERPQEAEEVYLAYLSWADEAEREREAVDACRLLAHVASAEARVGWLQRAWDRALVASLEEQLRALAIDLAVALEEVGQLEEAYEAYTQAIQWSRDAGRERELAAATWAAGATAVVLEAWPDARAHLEEAIERATAEGGSRDLVALASADLAKAERAAGDVVEARRLVLRALARGREANLRRLWPARWREIQALAEELEVRG